MLWLSRHYMTIDQRDDLVEIFGYNPQISHYTKQIISGQEIFNLAKDFSILGVVLPIHIINELFEIKREQQWPIRVIYSVAGRHQTGKKIINPANDLIEKEYAFSHLYWQEILDINVQLQRL